jgi:hypothetical protein
MARLSLLGLLALSLLNSCVSSRPLVLDADDPASPTARSATTGPAQPILGADPLTKRTRQLIAARAAQETQGQQQQSDQEMKDMPGKQHKEDDMSQHHSDHDQE